MSNPVTGFVDQNGATRKYDFNSLENSPITKGTGANSLISVHSTSPNTASGSASIALGADNQATANGAISIGTNDIASGINAIAIGNKISNKPHNQATNLGSVAIGSSNQATGVYAVAMGREATASGGGSVSAGYLSTASGAISFATGSNTEAAARFSSVFGNSTKATGGASIVAGAFNALDENEIDTSHGTESRKYVMIIGNGADDDNRSNAMTLDWDGNLNIAGELTTSTSTYAQMSLPAIPRTKYRYIWHDNFHRADGDDLGTNGDASHPMVYEYAGAQLKILNNACVNLTAAKGQAFADMHVSDCIIEYEADTTNAEYSTRGCGIMARRTGPGDFIYCQLRWSNIKIGKVVNGTTTELRNIVVTGSTVSPIKISLLLKGSEIRCLSNGVEVATLYESFNQDATVHGIYMDSGSSTKYGKIYNFGVKVEQPWQVMVDYMDQKGKLPYNITAENGGKSYNFAIQSSITNNSNSAIRFENRKADSSIRSEIAVKGYGSMLDEQVHSWDMYLGSDYSVLDSMSEIIMQMHDRADDGDTTGINPSFSIFVKNGKYYVHSQYSPYHPAYNTADIVSNDTEIGSYLNDIEKWVHWVLHVKWAYNEFFEPVLELYKNGKLVYTSKRPNVVNAAGAPYFKVGMYNYNWIEHPDSMVSTVRTLYVDNIVSSY